MKRPKQPGLLVTDALLAGGCYVAAYLIRLYPDLIGFYLATMAKTTPAVILVAALSFYATGLYRSIPKYASLDTLIAVARSATVAVALAALVLFIGWRGERIPRSVFVIQWMLMLLMLGGLRTLPRLRRYRRLIPLWQARADRVPVLIYGAGDAGEIVVRDILGRDDSPYWPVGFIDDDPEVRGYRVHGRPVLGTGDELPRIARETSAREILIAIPSASGAQLRRIMGRCRAVPDVTVKTLPALADLIEGRVTVREFHPVRIEDLLRRTPRDLDPARVREFIRGRRVLVTGAGGSIGSELSRQIAAIGPAELTLFEQSEYNLYTMEQELTRAHPDLPVRPALGDASHSSSVEPVIADARPEVVFHAAAYKHVPLLERNPCEGVLNNVLGVVNTARAADAVGTETFVFISTDKAVEPVSVMGAAKRLGEIFVQAMAARSETRFAVVRFGNVLGSSGSVIPKFAAQIRRGDPVTVTHPDATRYFMLRSEAVQLVMQAASLRRSGDIFVLDMGEPVPIVELARDLARLLNGGEDGGGDLEMEFTGLRPGEKLHERLALARTDERPSGYDSLMIEGYRSELDWRPLTDGLDALVRAARRGDVTATLLALRELVPEYRPATAAYAELTAPTVQPV